MISDEDHVSGHIFLKVRIGEHRFVRNGKAFWQASTVLPKTTGMEVLKRLWNPQIHQNISPEYQEIQGRIFWKTGTIL